MVTKWDYAHRNLQFTQIVYAQFSNLLIFQFPIIQYLRILPHENVQTDISHSAFDTAVTRLNGWFPGENSPV
jgi:hypothetical protein